VILVNKTPFFFSLKEIFGVAPSAIPQASLPEVNASFFFLIGIPFLSDFPS